MLNWHRRKDFIEFAAVSLNRGISWETILESLGDYGEHYLQGMKPVMGPHQESRIRVQIERRCVQLKIIEGIGDIMIERIHAAEDIIRFTELYEQHYEISRDPRRFASKLAIALTHELKMTVVINSGPDDPMVVSSIDLNLRGGWRIVKRDRINDLTETLNNICKGMTRSNAEREVHKYHADMVQLYRIMHIHDDVIYESSTPMESLQIES